MSNSNSSEKGKIGLSLEEIKKKFPPKVEKFNYKVRGSDKDRVSFAMVSRNEEGAIVYVVPNSVVDPDKEN